MAIASEPSCEVNADNRVIFSQRASESLQRNEQSIYVVAMAHASESFCQGAVADRVWFGRVGSLSKIVEGILTKKKTKIMWKNHVQEICQGKRRNKLR